MIVYTLSAKIKIDIDKIDNFLMQSRPHIQQSFLEAYIMKPIHDVNDLKQRLAW